MDWFNKFLLILLCSLLFVEGKTTTPASQIVKTGQEDEVNNEENNLKVLSWNIYMLPKIVPRKGKKERAHAIVEELKKADYDVIVFQEAFLPAAREIIGNGLATIYQYQYGPFNDERGLKISSGVWVISKIKLEVLGTCQFKNCTGIDCYARKGAALLQGTWNGKKFQILGTHLQADGFPEIREKQMNQMYVELLSKHKAEGVPQIVCGDMNTENEIKEHYCEMLNCLDAEDGEFCSVEKETYDGVNNEIAQSYGAKKKYTLDYILLRANGAKMKSVKRTVSVMRKGKKHLSDHYGVVCELKF